MDLSDEKNRIIAASELLKISKILDKCGVLMIISIETGQERTRVPYSKDFSRWRRNLSNADYMRIHEKLNEVIDSNEIHTAG